MIKRRTHSFPIKLIFFMLSALIALSGCNRNQADPGDWDIFSPRVDFSANQEIPIVGDTITFVGNKRTGSSNIVKWEWTINNDEGIISTAIGQEISFAFNKTGRYKVELIASDSIGQTQYIYKNITVQESLGIPLRVMVILAKPSPASYDLDTYNKLADIINFYEPDLAILRQLDSATNRANGINTVGLLSQKTGMNAFFAKAFDYQNGAYGNCILSRFPIIEDRKIELPPHDGGEVRVAPLVKIKMDDEKESEIVFVGTELAPEADRRSFQLNTLLDELEQINDPLILAGNFNDSEDSQTILQIQNELGLACENGCPFNNTSSNPTRTLDYVFYKTFDKFSLSETNVGSTGNTITTVALPVLSDLIFNP